MLSRFSLAVATVAFLQLGANASPAPIPATATTPGPKASALSVSAVAPSASAPSSNLPSQLPLPPKQAWCPSEIFCAGSLLQSLNVANLFTDQKTIVDKPTSKGPSDVVKDFKNLFGSGDGTNVTEEQTASFINDNFKAEGQELEALVLSNFNNNPSFLKNISDPLAKGFASAVHGFWPKLIRGTNETQECDGKKCESSLIPLNHTFVVPGGRFREQYYWDSFWIMEGLLTSELFDIAKDTLENFMDELNTIGFIPNGGRIYYLNRSQPPLFIQMLARYVQASGDKSILDRALPLAEKELKWWEDNRQVQVTPSSGKAHSLFRYNVNNTAPRPESYLTDYNTAKDLDEDGRSNLYAELASGAETGWDYTSRWIKGGSGDLTQLRVRETVPVCLNSILYKNHMILADLYGDSKKDQAKTHTDKANALKDAILDVFWNPSKVAFYDWSLDTNSQNNIFSAATFYPLWSGIIPDEILTNANGNATFSFFSSINLVMQRYNGTFPTTFIDTGLQWDAPNSWPPHHYVAISALRALPSNLTSLPFPDQNSGSFSLVPSGQLGMEEKDLPGQPIRFQNGKNVTQTGAGADASKSDGSVVNGGKKPSGDEGFVKALERQMANRYLTAALCSWHATGGSIPDVLPRLSDKELNVTLSTQNDGNMFEKFSVLDVDSAGRGGEYTVQAGFGWTNGVLLWVASNYGDVLAAPECPKLLDANGNPDGGKKGAALKSGPAGLLMIVSAVVACVGGMWVM